MTDPRLGPSPAQVARMRANIALEIGRRRRARAHARRVTGMASAAVAAVSIVAGTFAAAYLPEPFTQGSYVCFSGDNRAAESDGISFPLDVLPPVATADQVAASTELCAAVWAAEGTVAPDPVACRLFDGRLGVFPNLARRDDGDLCARVGLALP